MFFKSRSTETGEIPTESGGNARIGRLKSQTESGEDENGEQSRVTKAEETRGRAR